MELRERGEDLIKSFEKLRLMAYRPIPSDPWTIGYGHTRNVYEGMTITTTTAETLFDEDIAVLAKSINGIGARITQSMFDALASLCFNVGTRSISSQSIIGKAIRTEDWLAAWRGFSLWTATPGAELGLARRRTKEMMLFLEDGWP